MRCPNTPSLPPIFTLTVTLFPLPNPHPLPPRHLSPKTTSSSYRLITLRAQSNLPFHQDQTDTTAAESSPAVDPLLRKLEDAIHRIIVRKSAPDWLPFVPGASYYVPPRRSRSHGLAQLVEKLANPLTEEESMSMTTVRGWPSSAYFIHADPKLSGSISLIIQAAFLREHEVELRHLSDKAIQTDCSKVIFLVRSQISLMKYISSQVHNDISRGIKRGDYLYFVPCRAVACEKILEEEKVHKLLRIGEYPLYIVPLDEDVFSFELDLCLKECLVDGDTSSLWHIAKAIHRLEFSCGVIPNVRAKGNASVRVADILNRMQIEEPVSSLDMDVPEINTVILLDREVDMVTPLCTQLTYEGIADQFLRINNGYVDVDPSVMDVKQDGQKMKVPLNSSDKLFKEIRDLHFEVVVQILRQKATSMQHDYKEVTANTQTVSEIKNFVKRMHSYPEVARHINLAKHLMTFTYVEAIISWTT